MDYFNEELMKPNCTVLANTPVYEYLWIFKLVYFIN